MADSVAPESPILILCRDLLLASKITATAQVVGAPVSLIRDPVKLSEHAGSRRLIVDLNQEGFLDAALAWKQGSGGEVTGFAGHADVQTLDRAQSLGFSVMARGAFVAQLPQILAGTR